MFRKTRGKVAVIKVFFWFLFEIEEKYWIGKVVRLNFDLEI